MTSTNRMSNFKRMVELLAQGGKLLTTEGKLMAMAIDPAKEFIAQSQKSINTKVRLVLKPSKRYTPH